MLDRDFALSLFVYRAFLKMRLIVKDFKDFIVNRQLALIDKLQKTVNAGRQRLSIGGAEQDPTSNTGQLPSIEESSAFFDQDI